MHNELDVNGVYYVNADDDCVMYMMHIYTIRSIYMWCVGEYDVHNNGVFDVFCDVYGACMHMLYMLDKMLQNSECVMSALFMGMRCCRWCFCIL